MSQLKSIGMGIYRAIGLAAKEMVDAGHDNAELAYIAYTSLHNIAPSTGTRQTFDELFGQELKLKALREVSK